MKDKCDLNAPIDGIEDERRLEASEIEIRTQIGDAFYIAWKTTGHILFARGEIRILSHMILYKLTINIHETYFDSGAKYDQN